MNKEIRNFTLSSSDEKALNGIDKSERSTTDELNANLGNDNISNDLYDAADKSESPVLSTFLNIIGISLEIDDDKAQEKYNQISKNFKSPIDSSASMRHIFDKISDKLPDKVKDSMEKVIDVYDKYDKITNFRPMDDVLRSVIDYTKDTVRGVDNNKSIIERFEDKISKRFDFIDKESKETFVEKPENDKLDDIDKDIKSPEPNIDKPENNVDKPENSDDKAENGVDKFENSGDNPNSEIDKNKPSDQANQIDRPEPNDIQEPIENPQTDSPDASEPEIPETDPVDSEPDGTDNADLNEDDIDNVDSGVDNDTDDDQLDDEPANNFDIEPTDTPDANAENGAVDVDDNDDEDVDIDGSDAPSQGEFDYDEPDRLEDPEDTLAEENAKKEADTSDNIDVLNNNEEPAESVEAVDLEQPEEPEASQENDIYNDDIDTETDDPDAEPDNSDAYDVDNDGTLDDAEAGELNDVEPPQGDELNDPDIEGENNLSDTEAPEQESQENVENGSDAENDNTAFDDNKENNTDTDSDLPESNDTPDFNNDTEPIETEGSQFNDFEPGNNDDLSNDDNSLDNYDNMEADANSDFEANTDTISQGDTEAIEQQTEPIENVADYMDTLPNDTEIANNFDTGIDVPDTSGMTELPESVQFENNASDMLDNSMDMNDNAFDNSANNNEIETNMDDITGKDFSNEPSDVDIDSAQQDFDISDMGEMADTGMDMEEIAELLL